VPPQNGTGRLSICRRKPLRIRLLCIDFHKTSHIERIDSVHLLQDVLIFELRNSAMKRSLLTGAAILISILVIGCPNSADAFRASRGGGFRSGASGEAGAAHAGAEGEANGYHASTAGANGVAVYDGAVGVEAGASYGTVFGAQSGAVAAGGVAGGGETHAAEGGGNAQGARRFNGRHFK
jgi:hypothetical protein